MRLIDWSTRTASTVRIAQGQQAFAMRCRDLLAAQSKGGAAQHITRTTYMWQWAIKKGTGRKKLFALGEASSLRVGGSRQIAPAGDFYRKAYPLSNSSECNLCRFGRLKLSDWISKKRPGTNRGSQSPKSCRPREEISNVERSVLKPISGSLMLWTATNFPPQLAIFTHLPSKTHKKCSNI